MAEKIDKTEYVDNSKVFFDFLLHTHQWSNITPVEYNKWLSNFNDIPDGQYIACRLLDYHLNKIYAPYFEISYFKKRKIVFTNSQISDLLSGNKSKAEQVSKEYLDRYLCLFR